MNQIWMPPVPGLWQFSKGHRSPCGLPMLAALGLGEAWSVSRSHQGGASGIHEVNADSDMAPVLSFVPFSKRPTAH